MGLIQEAVKHAFQTQDWKYAAAMVERHAWSMILHSQVGIVSDWCQTFPEAVIGKRPALCIFHGWALIIAFKKDNFPAANVRIQQAEAALLYHRSGGAGKPGCGCPAGQHARLGDRPVDIAALLYSDD